MITGPPVKAIGILNKIKNDGCSDFIRLPHVHSENVIKYPATDQKVFNKREMEILYESRTK